MIVSFCGHRDFIPGKDTKKNFIGIIKALIKEHGELVCYCGGYGKFDLFVAGCLNGMKKELNNLKVTLILPYLSLLNGTSSFKYQMHLYDETIYPPLEKVPYKAAICKRNEWIVDNSDTIICYVKYTYGGAHRMRELAKKRGVTIIDLD